MFYFSLFPVNPSNANMNHTLYICIALSRFSRLAPSYPSPLFTLRKPVPGAIETKRKRTDTKKRLGKNPTLFYYSLQPLNRASNCRTLKAFLSNLLVSNEKTSSHSFPKLWRHIAKRRFAAACFFVSPVTSTFVASKPFLTTFLFMLL